MPAATTLDAPQSGIGTKTKKPLWKSLGFQIIVAMVLGAAVGFLFPSFAAQLKILGDIFLRLIKTAVAPLVFLFLFVSVWRHNHSTYQQKYAQWSESFICERCGTVSQHVLR